MQRIFGVACLALMAIANTTANTTEAATIFGRGAANIAAVYESEFTMDGNDQAITTALVVEAGSLVSTDDGNTWMELENRTAYRPGDVEVFIADESTIGLPENVANFAGFPEPNDVPGNQKSAPTLEIGGEVTLGFSADLLINPTYAPTDPNNTPIDTFSTFTFNVDVTPDGPPTVVAWRNDGTADSDIVVSNDADTPKNSALSFAPDFGFLQEDFNWTFRAPGASGTDPVNFSSTFGVDVLVEFAGGETPGTFLPAETFNFLIGPDGSTIPTPPGPTPTVIPEPGTGIALLLFGGASLLSRRRRTA